MKNGFCKCVTLDHEEPYSVDPVNEVLSSGVLQASLVFAQLISQPLVGWMWAQVTDSVLIMPILLVLWIDHLLFAFVCTLRTRQQEHGSSLGLIPTPTFRNSWVFSVLPLPICLQEVIFECAAGIACCSWLCWWTKVNMCFYRISRVNFSALRVSFCTFSLGSWVGSRVSSASKEWNGM